MTVPAVVESVDDVPEGLEDHYTDGEGGLVLDVRGIDDHPGVGELRRAYRREQKRRRDAESDLERYEGVDPDEYEELLELRENPPDGTEDIEAVREELQEKWQRKLDKERKDREEAESRAEKVHEDFVMQRAKADFFESVGEKGNARLLWPHVRDRVKPIDGEVDYALLDEEGLEAPIESMDKFVSEMREQERYQDAFYAEREGGGSGADSTARGGSGAEGAATTMKRSDQTGWAENAEGIAEGSVEVVD